MSILSGREPEAALLGLEGQEAGQQALGDLQVVAIESARGLCDVTQLMGELLLHDGVQLRLVTLQRVQLYTHTHTSVGYGKSTPGIECGVWHVTGDCTYSSAELHKWRRGAVVEVGLQPSSLYVTVSDGCTWTRRQEDTPQFTPAAGHRWLRLIRLCVWVCVLVCVYTPTEPLGQGTAAGRLNLVRGHQIPWVMVLGQPSYMTAETNKNCHDPFMNSLNQNRTKSSKWCGSVSFELQSWTWRHRIK